MMNTSIGQNWHVLVFESPIRLIDDILPYIWNYLQSIKEKLRLPHYTIRDKVNQGNSVVISLHTLDGNSKTDYSLLIYVCNHRGDHPLR